MNEIQNDSSYRVLVKLDLIISSIGFLIKHHSPISEHEMKYVAYKSDILMDFIFEAYDGGKLTPNLLEVDDVETQKRVINNFSEINRLYRAFLNFLMKNESVENLKLDEENPLSINQFLILMGMTYAQFSELFGRWLMMMLDSDSIQGNTDFSKLNKVIQSSTHRKFFYDLWVDSKIRNSFSHLDFEIIRSKPTLIRIFYNGKYTDYPVSFFLSRNEKFDKSGLPLMVLLVTFNYYFFINNRYKLIFPSTLAFPNRSNEKVFKIKRLTRED